MHYETTSLRREAEVGEGLTRIVGAITRHTLEGLPGAP
jgi:hypothetical protein